MPAGDETLGCGFHLLYDLNFTGAQKAFTLHQLLQPDDPRGQVAVAAGLLFAEFHRLGVLESQFLTDDTSFSRGASPRPILSFMGVSISR